MATYMKMLIGFGGGLLIGTLCLLQVLSVLSWMPGRMFTALHMPAILLAGLVAHGESAWDAFPYAVVLQWVLLGGLVGGILHLTLRSKGTP